MPRMPRRALPADEKGSRKAIAKTITSDELSSGGKLNPARGLPGGSGIMPEEEKKEEQEQDVHKCIYVPFIKASEEQTVTGVVLQPEVVDAQGDIMSEDVIKKAAHSFLSRYNQTVKKASKLGLMHKYFDVKFELLESWIAPHDVVINGSAVKKGAWVITVRVKDAKVWKQVKDGVIKGFSIGGKAKVKQIKQAA